MPTIHMRWRGLAVLTNTPPRSQQRSPGPMQANAIMEPVVTKAAKKLGLDQVAIRRINSPEGKALYGGPAVFTFQRDDRCGDDLVSLAQSCAVAQD